MTLKYPIPEDVRPPGPVPGSHPYYLRGHRRDRPVTTGHVSYPHSLTPQTPSPQLSVPDSQSLRPVLLIRPRNTRTPTPTLPQSLDWTVPRAWWVSYPGTLVPFYVSGPRLVSFGVLGSLRLCRFSWTPVVRFVVTEWVFTQGPGWVSGEGRRYGTEHGP